MTAAPPRLLGAYQRLYSASQQQGLALSAADIEGFWEVSSKREEVFSELQSLEPEAATLDEPTRALIRDLIQMILASDRALDAALTALSSETQDELSSLHNGLQALHSYVQADESLAMFIDRSS